MILRPSATAAGDGAIAIAGDAHGPVTAVSVGTMIVGGGAVPVLVAAQDPRSVFSAVGLRHFTGRDWLAAEIDSFIGASPCGYLFIEADAGMGKSAFAAWLVSTRGYPSHFSRYPGGRSARTALANLAAQLVRDYQLEEWAPGGMLPDWARTPDGFAAILAEAAGRAAAAGRRLVIVADGLDEAEPAEDGLPFGLPSYLPDGVYLIATCRTGHLPPMPESPSVTFAIKKDDQRNTVDIAAYLDGAVAEQAIAGRLAAADIEPAEFSARLAERCGGVWVYLRYVLDEVRAGLRDPADVDDLPDGLWAYYAEQVRRWRTDAQWATFTLPLLATLAVAGEPLPPGTLARLAGGLDAAAVRRTCNLTLRPLLNAQSAPRRFELYHASLREMLTGQQADGANWPDHLLALNDEFRQASADAHSQIADTYLHDFGGLDRGLPALASEPAMAQADDGYPLRHLARHLLLAGRIADLHALLAAARADPGAPPANVWFEAHDRAYGQATYLDDLDRARDIAADQVSQDMARGALATTLGAELRYRLMAASVVSHGAEVPDVILQRLLNTGTWSVARALDHAHRLTNLVRRAEAIAVIAPFQDAPGRLDTMSEVLDATAAIADQHTQGKVLAALAPCLPDELFDRALAFARAIEWDYVQLTALISLAPSLPPAERAEVHARAIECVRSDLEREDLALLASLAPALDVNRFGEVLVLIAAVSDEFERHRALHCIAPHIPDQFLGEALTIAGSWWSDLDLCLPLIDRLPAERRGPALAEALAAIEAKPDELARMSDLLLLGPHLDEDLAQEALRLARDMARPYTRVMSLASLADRLPADDRESVRAAALAELPQITDSGLRVFADAHTVRFLAPDQRAAAAVRVFDAATSELTDRKLSLLLVLDALIPDLPRERLAAAFTVFPDGDSDQAEHAFSALVTRVSADNARDMLLAITAMNDAEAGIEAMVAGAGLLPEAERADALASALAVVVATPGEEPRAAALAALAPQLTVGLLTDALAIAAGLTGRQAFAQAMGAVLASLPAEERSEALVARTLSAHSPRWNDGWRQARILGALARCLPDALVVPALRVALAIDPTFRNPVLDALLPRAPQEAIEDIAAAAVRGLTQSSDTTVHWRASELAYLAPWLAGDALANTLAAVMATTDPARRALGLAQLAPHLPEPLAASVASDLAAIETEEHYGTVLAGLLPRLRPDAGHALLMRAFGLAIEDIQAAEPGPLFWDLVPLLDDALKGKALAAVTALPAQHDRDRALLRLAPALPEPARREQLAAFTAAVASLFDGNWWSDERYSVAGALPTDLLPAALAGAFAITDEAERLRALLMIQPRLTAELADQALVSARGIESIYHRACLQRWLLPLASAEQRAAALPEALAAIDALPPARGDYARAVLLGGVAPYLPADQLPARMAQAVASVAASSPEGRSEALAVLAPVLPASLLSAALHLVPMPPTPARDRRALPVLLDRCEAALAAADGAEALTLIRSWAAVQDRRKAVAVIARAAEAVARIGGPDAVRDVTQAVSDIYAWWP